MSSNSSNPPGSGKKIRKPYTITKSRESWTDEEHDKFLEALQLFDRDWKKIEDFIGSKTVIQIRSHAQKYFLKVQKNGTVAHVPPPRPKRKAAHPYPHKAASKNGYPSSSLLNPLAPAWDDASVLMDNPSVEKTMPSENDYNPVGVEADNGLKGAVRNYNINGYGNPPRAPPSSELETKDKQDHVLHGIPDFAEVYSFIGSVFDPDSRDHVQKLKEMDPINFETVLLLMRNLTVNLSNPDFEPIRKALSSYEVGTHTIGVSAETVVGAE